MNSGRKCNAKFRNCGTDRFPNFEICLFGRLDRFAVLKYGFLCRDFFLELETDVAWYPKKEFEQVLVGFDYDSDSISRSIYSQS